VQWQDLPALSADQTCHRRVQPWVRAGVFPRLLHTLATDLQEWGGIDLPECCIDGTCVVAKKGSCTGTTMRGSGTTVMAVVDRAGLPVAVHVARAAPPEVTRVDASRTERFGAARPVHLIGEQADDSDPLDARLGERGLERIAPYRSRRKQPNTQDGRPLRRDTRRWKVERLFAWLQNFRRVLVRHDYYAENDLGFVHRGCLMILLRWHL
jgi:transposase